MPGVGAVERGESRLQQEQAHDASILIVDDVPSNLMALGALLQPLGVRIVEAASGAEAIALAAREQFALVLLDVQMPGIDGFEVAKRLRQSDASRETPIIFLTAIHRDEEYARKGYELGGADYLMKPIDADVLRARARAFVDLFKQRESLRLAQVRLRTSERDEAIRQLVAFERVASAALESTNLDAFLSTLLTVFQEAVSSVDGAGIMLREGDELVARSSLGLDDGVASAFRERIGEGFAGVIAAKKQPLHLMNAADSPLVRKSWVRNQGCRGLLGAPLLIDGEVFGVAYIGSMNVADFSPSERRLFGAVVDKAASAVDRVRSRRVVEQLLEAEKIGRKNAEEAARRQSFLAQVSGVLSSSLDIDATLESVVRMTVPGFADWCAVHLVDEVGTIALDCVAHGEPEDDPRWEKLASSATTVFDIPGVIRANRAGVEPGPGSRDDGVMKGLGLVSWMSVPLRRRDAVIGTLSLASVTAGRDLAADTAFAEEVAIRVAMAVENAQLYQRAQAAIRIREDFVSIASHELKTPLTPLKLQLASLQRRLPEDRGVVLDRLAIADRQVDKIEELVSQLLDVSKIAAGRFDLQPQWIDLRRIAERVFERFANNPAAAQMKLEGAARACLDPFRMEQLLTNLVSNAVKYGQGKPIEVSLSTDESQVRLSVRDHGIGIGALEQTRIFDRFERAVSSSQYGGFGLGLWIARQIVEASGGRISVTSTLGAGADFVVLLPKGAERERGRISGAGATPGPAGTNGVNGVPGELSGVTGGEP
jgi:signal transduction histidine kinase/DNA-binding response OmpR family regulator